MSISKLRGLKYLVMVLCNYEISLNFFLISKNSMDLNKKPNRVKAIATICWSFTELCAMPCAKDFTFIISLNPLHLHEIGSIIIPIFIEEETKEINSPQGHRAPKLQKCTWIQAAWRPRL